MGTLSCLVNNVSYSVLNNSFRISDPVDARTLLTLTIVDLSGTANFLPRTPITLSDSVSGPLFKGLTLSSKPQKQSPDSANPAILHAITAADMQAKVDSRANTTNYTNLNAGDIVTDFIASTLINEGVTGPCNQRYDTTTSDWNRGVLSTTAGVANVGDGDLELATAGTTVTITEATTADFSSGTLTGMQATGNALTPTTINALKMQSTLSFSYGTQFAQGQQTASGTVNGTGSGSATGTVSGNASGNVSANPSGNLNTTINTSTNYTPAGNVTIFGGQPGESASFSGNGVTLSPSGNLNTTINTSFNTTATLPFSTNPTLAVSTSFSAPFSGSVTAQYIPKTRSKVKIDATHYAIVTVDQAVADNRVDATIWTGSMTVASNDTLNYDIWISSTSPSQEGGIDLLFSDGTQLTQYLGTIGNNTDTGIWDQNLLSVSPIQDLSDYAKDTWYHRQVNLSLLAGKTITGVSMFNAGNIAGTFDIYIKNCYLGSQSGSPFFGTTQTAPTLNPPTVSSIGAYVTAATIVTVVAAFQPATSSRISPAYSIDAVKLVKDSLITWSAVNTVTGPSVVPGSQGAAATAWNEAIFVSYDATTWLPCTEHSPLPGLPAGANVSGMSLYLMETFAGGQDPSALPVLNQVKIVIHSAATASTTDSATSYGNATAWNTGTMQGATVNSNGDLILGSTSYFWSNLSKMAFVPGNLSSSNPTQSVSGGAYVISSSGSSGTSWSASRFNFISAAQDFTAEADFTLSSSSPLQNEIGFVYRQTYWGSPNNSFAYYVRIMQAPGGQAGGTSVTLGYGINNPPSANFGGGPASGTFTVITQSSQTISNGTTYHVKLVVGQNRHTIYWNGGTTPIIDVLDNTYTAAGNIGIRTYVQSTNSCTASIANFTITNTFAGLWTSPSINLNSLLTCGNTQVSWSEVISSGAPQSTTAVMASLDGGTTWQQCTNGATSSTATIPGLPFGTNVSGKSLKLQVVLSATAFLTAPIITGLYVRVCGAYPTVSGTRSTIPLGNDTAITRTVGSGWGTAFDGQTWAQTGTGTTAVGSGEETIANTTGDVHMVLGSRTGTDEEGTVRFQLSASTIMAGMELRYTNANNYYRLAASATALSIIKNTGGGNNTLSTATVSLTTGTWYRLRFRCTGAGPVSLQGKVWADGTLEPGISNGIMNLANPQWTVVASD